MTLFDLLIWLVKLPIKVSHQTIAALVHWELVKSIHFSLVTEAWPSGNVLGESPDARFVGFRIAMLRVPIDRILVTNDLPNPHPRDSGKEFIPIQESNRFNRAMGNKLSEIGNTSGSGLGDSDSQLTKREQKILFLSKSQVRYSCSVILKLNGDVLVIDGAHRLFATILRDKNIDNINIYITI